ncbi:MFS transporter [Leucobacter sp. UT-8R-CII-1-4]|uniref:Cmx/CmrA family chloramphenicol efflux MFS transporter n=1 Tax=Leucobacter sp. UT-8R-CII-1-4 TaxID=3040075 RepID=UPI0024A85A4A|nr:Cmx/CmrA family chloramphenicol efflux MFS transporter [Leucobacter sp. UT-8R-CII-1-4]MDI6022719.1 MFS transporter [Leucobacter sp. UT-8R-CII-1-4]
MPILVYLLALAVFAQGTSEFMLAGLLPGISADLNIPISSAGLLTSAFALGLVIGAPVMAIVSRRLPMSATLSGFLAVFIAMHVIAALGSSFEILLTSRAVSAFAYAGFLAVTLSSIMRVVPQRIQPRAISIILAGTTLALIVGVPAGAAFGEVLGWRATFWGVAALCLPAALMLPFVRSTQHVALRDEGQHVDGLGDPTPKLHAEFAALKQPKLLQAIVLAVLVNAATFCSFTYLAAISVQRAGIAQPLVPLVLTLFGVGSFAGVLLAGKLGQLPWRRIVLPGTLLLGALWLGLAAVSDRQLGVWIIAVALGAASFAVGSTLIARVLQTSAGAPTLGGAYSTTALNLGAFLGPALGGAAITWFGLLAPPLLSAIFVLSAALLIVFSRHSAAQS